MSGDSADDDYISVGVDEIDDIDDPEFDNVDIELAMDDVDVDFGPDDDFGDDGFTDPMMDPGGLGLGLGGPGMDMGGIEDDFVDDEDIDWSDFGDMLDEEFLMDPEYLDENFTE